MKVAVSASGADLDSPIDPRFGRCQYLMIVDTETMQYESMPNPAMSAPGGAGIQAAQLVVGKGAKAVLTGRCGPNACQVFQANGVEVVQGVGGIVAEAVKAYSRGEVATGQQPATPGFSGRRGFARQQPPKPRPDNLEELEGQVRDARAHLDRLTQALEEMKESRK